MIPNEYQIDFGYLNQAQHFYESGTDEYCGTHSFTAVQVPPRPWLSIRKSRLAPCAASGHNPPGTYAALHDFCMAIPYAAIAVVGGLASLAVGSGPVGLVVFTGGVIISFAAMRSLKSWKKLQSSTIYTAISAGEWHTASSFRGNNSSSALLNLFCDCRYCCNTSCSSC